MQNESTNVIYLWIEKYMLSSLDVVRSAQCARAARYKPWPTLGCCRGGGYNKGKKSAGMGFELCVVAPLGPGGRLRSASVFKTSH